MLFWRMNQQFLHIQWQSVESKTTKNHKDLLCSLNRQRKKNCPKLKTRYYICLVWMCVKVMTFPSRCHCHLTFGINCVTSLSFPNHLMIKYTSDANFRILLQVGSHPGTFHEYYEFGHTRLTYCFSPTM